jgi:hypothetical protein
VIDQRAQVLASGTYGTDGHGYSDMLTVGQAFPERVWAIEGCNGIGKHIAHRLVHDGESVLDVPAKLSAQVRVFAVGNGCKTDPVDAHSVALVALRTPNLVAVTLDPDLQVLGMLVDRLRCVGEMSVLMRHVGAVFVPQPWHGGAGPLVLAAETRRSAQLAVDPLDELQHSS